eukprot:GEMP01026913.1.p1 GENE.GEMP01026913.1~~GEMP01026913.1.p1  ORF type:complete len:222 (+),score=29.55 GEMP01026913.1:38-703(+)
MLSRLATRLVPKHSRSVFVIAEQTPNPESIMFYPQGKSVLGENAKAKSYIERHGCHESPLATALFKINGVNQILLGQRHITITKGHSASWDHIKPNVELVVSQFFAAQIPPINPTAIEYYDTQKPVAIEFDPSDEPIEKQIEELLMTRVQPFVQQDGGDIEFLEYKDNVVYIKMQGACAGCPKSNITLNFQIKNLVQHFFPDVVDVVGIDETAEQEIPRPH